MVVIINPSLPLISIHNKLNPKPSTGRRVVFMLAKPDSHTQKRSSPSIQIKSNIKLQKVFEDGASGVVCYKDDKGEIICEGYDEGPRLHQHSLTRSSCYQRNGEAIVGLLKRSLLLAIDGVGKVN